MPQQIEVPLSKLKLDPSNVRGSGQLEPQFLASIAEKGVIQPLTVRQNGEGYLVTDGGKRLAAMQELSKRGRFEGDPLIRVDVREDDDLEATDTSLTTNYIRSDMHPVEEFEAFVKLQQSGMSKDDIRKRYGLGAKEVDQVLALGALSPNVRAAWKEGKLREDGAQAFTLEHDHARQDAILKKLGKLPNRWQVRNAIVGEQGEHGRYLAYVTAAAYEAAGGKIVRDLFAQQHEAASHVSDTALLMRLAEEKLNSECAKLVADGWGWAEVDDGHRRHQMDRLDRGGKKPPAADRPKAGCLLFIDQGGKLSVEKWFTKSKPAAAADKAKGTKAAKKEAAVKAPTVLSGALKQRLESQLLRATQQALIEDTKDSGLDTALAKIVASQITPDRPSFIPHAVKNGLDSVRANLTPKTILAATLQRFDAKDYFSNAPKNIVVAAIKEAGFTDDQAKTKTATKAEIWKFALANVPKTGWLPKELRGPYYVAPAAAGKPAAKAAKKKSR